MDILENCRSIFSSLFLIPCPKISCDKMQFYLYRLEDHIPNKADNSSPDNDFFKHSKQSI